MAGYTKTELEAAREKRDRVAAEWSRAKDEMDSVEQRLLDANREYSVIVADVARNGFEAE